MRGEDTQNQTLFSYVRTYNLIPSNHPLRLIRRIADAALTALSDQFLPPRNLCQVAVRIEAANSYGPPPPPRDLLPSGAGTNWSLKARSLWARIIRATAIPPFDQAIFMFIGQRPRVCSASKLTPWLRLAVPRGPRNARRSR
jgi:hypothetical protein